jgi:phosphatidate cytidylyltransferase
MNADLRKRIIPAIVYVIAIVISTLLGDLPSLILVQIFSLVCIYEFITNSLASVDKAIRGRYIVAVIIVGALLVNLVSNSQIWLILTGIICTIYTYNSFLIMTRGQSIFSQGNVVLSAIALALMPFTLVVNQLMAGGQFHLILLGVFIILWINDAGAYFVGRAIGRNKIHPTISPGKTWEGWIGGLLLGLLASWLISIYVPAASRTTWLMIGAICGVMGILGDLTESSWKRHHKIKDSGSIMPGHGGFLDRLDSFIYSIPFVILYLTLV